MYEITLVFIKQFRFLLNEFERLIQERYEFDVKSGINYD